MTATNSELIVKNWLETDTNLTDFPVSFDVPAKRPATFITVERTGGQSDAYFDHPTIAVQVWDTSRWNASNTAMQLVKPRLLSLWQQPNVGSVSVESVVNFPEPQAPYQARYQIVITLTCAVNS